MFIHSIAMTKHYLISMESNQTVKQVIKILEGCLIKVLLMLYKILKVIINHKLISHFITFQKMFSTFSLKIEKN